MAWKTAATGGNDYDGSLPDDERINVTLKSFAFVPNKFKPDEKRLELVWITDEYEQQEVTAWCSLRLGMKGTTIAAMRQLINAVEGRAPSDEVFAINDETLEYKIEAVPPEKLAKVAPDGQIRVGLKVAMIGTNTTSVNDSGEKVTYYNPTAYRARKKAKPAPAPEEEAPAARPARSPRAAAAVADL